MRQIRSILCSILVLASASTAFAKGGGGSGFFMDETFIPVYVSKADTWSFNGAPGVATESGNGYDLRTTLGYVFGSGLMVGLTYNMYSLTTNRPSVVGGDTGMNESTKQTEMGPTVGYISGGWRYLLTSFVSGEKSKQRKDLDDANAPTNDVTTKNSKLTGFQFSIGYTFALGSRFQIGPSLVYKSLTYSNQQRIDAMSGSSYDDAELYTKATEATLSPMISMSLLF